MSKIALVLKQGVVGQKSKVFRLTIARFLYGLLVLVSAGVVLLSVTPQGHALTKTILFLPQILPGLPFKPQTLVTRTPVREEVYYPTANGEGFADLYIPGSGSKHSAVLLFLGVNPAGRDDSRVVGLAEALARSGVVVMIPSSETMTQRRIAPQEVDNLVYAFQFLRDHEKVNPDSVGMGGFCVGASLSTVAAEDPRIRDNVRFINFFGGYYDAFDLLKSVASENRFYGDHSDRWTPNHLSVEVVTTHLIEGLGDDHERELLKSVFLNGDTDAKIDFSSLSDESSAVYALLSGPDLEEVDGLVQQLPKETIESLRFISPGTRIGDLKAKVLIMHDREDNLVPSDESRRLADAVGKDRGVYFTEFSFFEHLDPTQSVSPTEFASESFKLFLHMYNVMREFS
jgi:dienelactone hydrolase